MHRIDTQHDDVLNRPVTSLRFVIYQCINRAATKRTVRKSMESVIVWSVYPFAAFGIALLLVCGNTFRLPNGYPWQSIDNEPHNNRVEIRQTNIVIRSRQLPGLPACLWWPSSPPVRGLVSLLVDFPSKPSSGLRVTFIWVYGIIETRLPML